MSDGASVMDEHIVRLLQVGYVLEAIVEGRSGQHRNSLPTGPSGTHLAQSLLAEVNEESRRHREQLTSILESLNAEPPCAETVSGLVKTNYEFTHATTGAILYDQLCSELSAFRYYDGVHEWLIDERARLDLPVPPAVVLATVEDIRQEEREGFHDVLDAIESLGIRPTKSPPNAQS